MQAWTSVLVTDPKHPRFKAAGRCKGAPATQRATLLDVAQKARDRAADADAKEKDAKGALAELTKAAQAAAKDAVDAKKTLAAAEAAAAGGKAEEQVEVIFDTDGATETVPVASLQQLA